jgi:XTP/dITP diphosphohydrolase
MPESGDGLRELLAVMDRLRSPGGCPWDARQTHASLTEYLLEEAYETVEAIESGNRDDLREELGDLLLQVVFHARIAEEDPEDPWDIDAVARGIVAKLVRRHPHVFDDADATTAEQVEARWHDLKAQEKGRASVTEGIPEALPALLRASKLLARSARLDVPLPADSNPAPDAAAGLADEDAYGDMLLALVAAGRSRGWDAEAALRAAVRRHAVRIRDAERS